MSRIPSRLWTTHEQYREWVKDAPTEKDYCPPSGGLAATQLLSQLLFRDGKRDWRYADWSPWQSQLQPMLEGVRQRWLALAKLTAIAYMQPHVLVREEADDLRLTIPDITGPSSIMEASVLGRHGRVRLHRMEGGEVQPIVTMSGSRQLPMPIHFAFVEEDEWTLRLYAVAQNNAMAVYRCGRISRLLFADGPGLLTAEHFLRSHAAITPYPVPSASCCWDWPRAA